MTVCHQSPSQRVMGPVLVRHARVVHQHVHPAKGFHRLLYHPDAVLLPADVGRNRQHLAALGPKRFSHFVQLLLPPGAQHQNSPLFGKELGGAQADARIGPGDDGHLIL